MTRCLHCGGEDFWFDRTMEPGCDSMHDICRACGWPRSCGHDDCPYNYATTAKVDKVLATNEPKDE